MATCICSSPDCIQNIIEGVTYCTCTTVIPDVECPEGCALVMQPDGNAVCMCIDSVTPTIVGSKTPVFFDDNDYFEDISWTISYKATEGTWNSYFSFYPDYSIGHNNFFQVGYNWGKDKETLWNHLLNRSSFCVFQGEKHDPIIEFPVANENVNKILNSISLNIEPTHYQNDWEWTIDKDISFKNLYIYNKTNNTGMLGLNPQKTLTDLRNYPKIIGNTQEILLTSDQGKQNVNYFFNRLIKQANNIPMFNIDKNNIFKTINQNAVKFSGKSVLERLKGEWFIVHLEGMVDSRYDLILKNSINNETTLD